MVARLVAVEKRARSSRSLSAAVRAGMQAALRRQRAGSGKNGSCLWNCGNCFSTMPQTKTMGSTHWRASGALITWTTLRRAAVRGQGFGGGGAFVGGPGRVDHVAAAVVKAQGLEGEDAFDGAPVVLDSDFASGIEGGGGFGERQVEETEHGRLAAPLEREFMGGGLGGGRRAEEMAQRGEARG